MGGPLRRASLTIVVSDRRPAQRRFARKGAVARGSWSYCQFMAGKRFLVGAITLVAAACLGVGVATAKPPSGTRPPKHHRGITVGISYSNGSLVLASTVAGRAQIFMRSADGHHNWVQTVRLQAPTTSFPLKALFPKVTKGRYRVVVRPRFRNGFLSGAWITVP